MVKGKRLTVKNQGYSESRTTYTHRKRMGRVEKEFTEKTKGPRVN